MIRNFLGLGLSFSLVLGTSINSDNAQFSLQAATSKNSKSTGHNQANLNLYSYEGKKGRNGNDGRDGENGRNGIEKQITIDGSRVNLDLSGTDGRDGQYGRDGSDARCGSIDWNSKTQFELADGGHGGDGGNGGNGGNGGSLTVFYSQLEHLQQVNVRSAGGYGGRGAEGRRGGRGCICPPFIFSRPRTQSDQKTIRCRNGRDGEYGEYGKDGQDGQDGTLYLVKQGKDLRPDQPATEISLSSIAQNQPISLSNNIWQSRNGAGSLLHPNSIIADIYYEYVKRLEREVILIWQEARPISDFADREIGLELTEKDQLLVTYPQEVWLDATIIDTEQNTLLTINHAVAEEETTRLTRGLISGDRSNLVFNVIDQAKKSDILATQFKIKYRTSSDRFADNRGSRSYRTRYEGIVPAAAVSRDRQRFSLALGQLPIDNKYLLPGTSVNIELTIIRSLGNNSAEQKVNWEGQIRDRQ